MLLTTSPQTPFHSPLLFLSRALITTELARTFLISPLLALILPLQIYRLNQFSTKTKISALEIEKVKCIFFLLLHQFNTMPIHLEVIIFIDHACFYCMNMFI